jgi:histidyl-tRNA synthetase
VKVNDRRLLEGIREKIGVADDTQWLTVLRAIDKLDRLGSDAVRALLGEGRKDESGDFTKGAGLTSKDADLVCNFLFAETHLRGFELSPDSSGFVHGDELMNESGWAFSNVNTILGLSQFLETTRSGEQAILDLERMFKFLAASGYGSKRIRFDHSVVRGLEYYTGPVYEVELNFEIDDEKGRPIRFGSVGGGGRYDGLVSRFMGQPVPATGFSIGVSRLQAALAHLEKIPSKSPCSTASASPTISAWSPPCATPTSAPSSISAIRRTSEVSFAMPSAEMLLALFFKARMKRRKGKFR